MSDLESIRDIAKRLVAEYRRKKDRTAAFENALLEELLFDAQLTEYDRKMLRFGGIEQP